MRWQTERNNVVVLTILDERKRHVRGVTIQYQKPVLPSCLSLGVGVEML